MKDWPPLSPDEELARADSLLDQANALLSRHRPTTRDNLTESPDEALPPFGASLENEDLPILTEVVDDLDLPSDWAEQATKPLPPLSKPAAPPAPLDDAAVAAPAITLEDRIAFQIAERLIELDTQITRSIGDWMDREFPQLLQRELDRLAEHLQTEMRAHLRATLLPELSARISEQMNRMPDDSLPHDSAPSRR